MKAIPLTLAIFLLGAFTVNAQIGKTLDECTQHFGKPIHGPDSSSDGTCAFLVGKILVEALFHDGTADYLMFGKKGSHGRGEVPLTNNEISALMNDNAGGHKWALNPESPTAGWVTDDGQIFAARMAGGGLVIESKDRKDRDNAAKTPAAPK